MRAGHAGKPPAPGTQPTARTEPGFRLRRKSAVDTGDRDQRRLGFFRQPLSIRHLTVEIVRDHLYFQDCLAALDAITMFQVGRVNAKPVDESSIGRAEVSKKGLGRSDLHNAVMA